MTAEQHQLNTTNPDLTAGAGTTTGEKLYTLDTTQAEAMTYQTEEIRFTILGGIRLEGLDRMRVTLKIEVVNRKFKHYLNNPDIADLALRQNLDLYNDTQTEKLIRKTAERLEVGSTSVARALADITAQAEMWRLHQIENQRKGQEKFKKQLTGEETRAAKEFLSQPELMQRTGEAIGTSGVVGEVLNRLLMFIIFTSRKLNHPLHILSLGSSGTGKTYLQEKVSELIPDEDKLEITTLSENAFYYFGQRELSGKLILIEDLDGLAASGTSGNGAFLPLRELQSKRKISKTVTFKDSRGITKTITLTVEGPVSVAGCTTKERIYEDNANRSFLIYLDESETQDEAIMHYQKMRSAGLTDTDTENKIKNLLQNCQRLLQPVSIRNPYAPQLQLPKEVFKPRRTNKHYLDFIEAVTFYHQFQREQKADGQSGEVYIETTLEDIAEANKLMKEILLRKSDGLSGACRNYFEKLKEHLQQNSESTFTNRSAGQVLRMAHSTVKRHHLELLTAGLIKLNHDKRTKSHWYEITTGEEYGQLKSRIGTAIEEIYNKLQESKKHLSAETSVKAWPNGSHRLNNASEPVKALNNKKKKPSAQQPNEGHTEPEKENAKA